MEALIKDMQSDEAHPARPVLVISNRPEALGLKRAKSLGVHAICIDHKDYKNREEFEKAVQSKLIEHEAELVCLAGFMRILTPYFTAHWIGRMINIHPSLLPKHKGLNTHQRAIDSGDKIHGASVHWVNAELDAGAVIKQHHIQIDKDDNAESLKQKVLKIEHPLYCQALKSVAAELLNIKIRQ